MTLISENTKAPRLLVMKNYGVTVGNCYIIGEGHNDEVIVTSVTKAVISLTTAIVNRTSLNKQYHLQQHFIEQANSH